MSNGSVLEVKNLCVSYGGVSALKNISLVIPENRIIAIIGPSGCGKSTLLRSFNRLIENCDDARVTGSVYVGGEDIYESGIDVTRIRKKMGLLFQKPYPLPMSIYDNVAYGPRIHGTRTKKKIDEIVEKYLMLTNLWSEVRDRLHDPASKLSVGQQQRLCLARGLAIEPDIILADEPTSALDPKSSAIIEQAFHELKNNYTIIIVTHILRQARRLADYVAFMYLGELVEHGESEKIFDNPEKEMTREYMMGIIS